MNTINKTPKEKENGFSQFLLNRNPSAKFIRTYGIYLRGNVVRHYTKSIAHIPDIFMIEDMDLLYDVYDAVKLDENNIRLHNVYSGAVSAYIKYLVGKPLRVKVKQADNLEEN